MDLSWIIKKYNLVDLEEQLRICKEDEQIGATIEWYQLILTATDHIPNKIIEAQALDKPIEDYSEILNARQYARDKINQLA